MIMSQSLPIEESSSNVTSFALLPDFIEAVIKEALRKYPVASRGSFRVVSDENGVDLPIGLANCEGGEILYPETIHLKKGTWIGVNFFAAHHAKDNWGMDAFEFRPERWLKGGDDNNVHGDMNSPASYAGVGNSHDSISFLPFSYGVRNCVGMNLALWEIRTALKILMANYNFRFADSKFTDESYALQTDITLKPILGLPVYVSKIATAK
jgi:cytochrome P450